MDINCLYGTWKQVLADDQAPVSTLYLMFQPGGTLRSRIVHPYAPGESSSDWRIEEPDWLTITVVDSNPNDRFADPMTEVTRERVLKLSESELVLFNPELDMTFTYEKVAQIA